MKDTYTKTDLLAHLELLKPTGYTMNTNGFYIKEESSRKIEMFVGASEYFPHEVNFYSVVLRICFPSVENIFNQVCTNTSNTVYKSSNVRSTFGRVLGKMVLGNEAIAALKGIDVKDDSSFGLARPYLDQLIEAALSFVSTYDTLQKCYDYGETLDGEGRSYFYSQPLTSRKMIIKKLLNVSDYSTYATTIISNATGRGETAKAGFLQTLKNYLDSL